MAAGQLQRDGPAHRVATGDDWTHAQHGERGGSVVGDRGEVEGAVGAQASAVAAVVDSDEVGAGGERTRTRRYQLRSAVASQPWDSSTVGASAR